MFIVLSENIALIFPQRIRIPKKEKVVRSPNLAKDVELWPVI